MAFEGLDLQRHVVEEMCKIWITDFGAAMSFPMLNSVDVSCLTTVMRSCGKIDQDRLPANHMIADDAAGELNEILNRHQIDAKLAHHVSLKAMDITVDVEARNAMHRYESCLILLNNEVATMGQHWCSLVKVDKEERGGWYHYDSGQTELRRRMTHIGDSLSLLDGRLDTLYDGVVIVFRKQRTMLMNGNTATDTPMLEVPPLIAE